MLGRVWCRRLGATRRLPEVSHLPSSRRLMSLPSRLRLFSSSSCATQQAKDELEKVSTPTNLFAGFDKLMTEKNEDAARADVVTPERVGDEPPITPQFQAYLRWRKQAGLFFLESKFGGADETFFHSASLNPDEPLDKEGKAFVKMMADHAKYFGIETPETLQEEEGQDYGRRLVPLAVGYDYLSNDPPSSFTKAVHYKKLRETQALRNGNLTMKDVIDPNGEFGVPEPEFPVSFDSLNAEKKEEALLYQRKAKAFTGTAISLDEAAAAVSADEDGPDIIDTPMKLFNNPFNEKGPSAKPMPTTSYKEAVAGFLTRIIPKYMVGHGWHIAQDTSLDRFHYSDVEAFPEGITHLPCMSLMPTRKMAVAIDWRNRLLTCALDIENEKVQNNFGDDSDREEPITDNTVEHVVHYDIPDEWLLAFKKVRWPRTSIFPTAEQAYNAYRTMEEAKLRVSRDRNWMLDDPEEDDFGEGEDTAATSLSNPWSNQQWTGGRAARAVQEE
eukprot:TRINITY_DN677_c0_g1_i1.p1 TRINITY_DN677_c0_g1~~TRINITY_DN677_c0_g1_i1.p1  ORF type:complete len:500 (-),score=102.90 TRINITY_DN677_c0_g1_i1:41-1540(-)